MNCGIPSELVGEFIDAAVEDQAKAERMLAERPALRDARWIHDESLVHFLAVEGYADAVDFLCRHGFNVDVPNEFGDAALLDVATLGNDEIAAILLRFGADPNGRSHTRQSVLHCAVRSGNPRLVSLLLEAGARPDSAKDAYRTIFDALPDDPDRRAAIEDVLNRYGLTRPAPEG